MGEGDEDDFGSVYEANSHRAHLSAYVLVAGLVLELINAIIWYKGPETLAEMAAVLLIVSGVWGEIFFGHKARIAGDKQLAQYEARTAEAKHETERLRNENLLLQERLAPRSLSNAQFDVLQTLKGKFTAINIAAEVDGETGDFMLQICRALEAAGIAVGTYSRDPTLRGFGNMVCVVGEPSEDSPACDLLASTLEAAGIPIEQKLPWLPLDIRSRAPANVPMICIGVKSWPAPSRPGGEAEATPPHAK
jgi:hypothetical protein